MALTKADIAKLAALSKLSVADLEKAIAEKDEVPLTIAEGLQVFTGDELNTLQKNKYDAGSIAGIEIAVKDAKTKMGLEFTGKTIDGLVDAATKKAIAEANKNPDQRVVELQGKIDALQGNVSKYETTIAEKEAAMNSLRDTFELGKHVPAPKEGGVAYSQDEVIAIMKMRGYDFKRNSEGKMEPYKAGEVMRDKLGNAMPLGDVVTGFMKEARYITDEEGLDNPGGRGGKDKTGGGKITKMSQLKAKFQAEGKNLNGEEFSKAVEALAVADPNFDPSA